MTHGSYKARYHQAGLYVTTPTLGGLAQLAIVLDVAQADLCDAMIALIRGDVTRFPLGSITARRRGFNLVVRDAGHTLRADTREDLRPALLDFFVGAAQRRAKPKRRR